MNNNQNFRVFWIYKGKEYWWTEFEFDILFSYFFRFEQVNTIDFISKKQLVAEDELLSSLKKYMTFLMVDLLTDCYIEPTRKQLSKNPSRYEKIEFNEKLYRVDYRLSTAGRVIYSVYKFIGVLDEAYDANEKVIIKW